FELLIQLLRAAVGFVLRLVPELGELALELLEPRIGSRLEALRFGFERQLSAFDGLFRALGGRSRVLLHGLPRALARARQRERDKQERGLAALPSYSGSVHHVSRLARERRKLHFPLAAHGLARAHVAELPGGAAWHGQ